MAALLGAAGLAAAETPAVADCLLHTGWLNEQSVDFENLRYADTYTILVFWSQGSVKDTDSDNDDDGGADCAPAFRGGG